jgi:histidine triad (HIT) family protein
MALTNPLSDCLFCKIIAGKIPASVEFQTERVTVFHDIHPQAPIHLLVIPNAHVENVSQTLDKAIFADVMAAAREIAAQMGLTDYRLVVNNGAGAGQSVFHLHMHLLAGRPLHWPPG